MTSPIKSAKRTSVRFFFTLRSALFTKNHADNYRIFEGEITQKGGSYTFNPAGNAFEAVMKDSNIHSGVINVSAAAEGYNILPESMSKNVGGTYALKVAGETANYIFDLTYYLKVKSVKIGSTYYTIEDALNASLSKDTVIVVANTSFADRNVAEIIYIDDTYYTVKQGVTLLLPFDGKYSTSYTSRAGGRDEFQEIGDRYITMDMPQDIIIIVKGTMTVNATRSAIHRYMQCVPIGHSAVNMARDSKIIVSNGGALNVVGYVYGSGSILAEAGATVVEAATILGFRGGGYSTDIYQTVFPFNQHFINNIEVKGVYQAGAKLIGNAVVISSIGSLGGSGNINLISSDNNALIKLTDGYVTKEYDSDTGKITITTDGTAQMNNISVTIGSSLIGGFEINSAGQEIPFSGNFDIVINSGSVTADNIGIKLLPGASLTVNKGATLNLINGSRVFVYNNAKKATYEWDTDMIEWTYDGKDGNGNVNYPVTNYGDAYRVAPTKYYKMSDDAVFTVNGVVNVEGSKGEINSTIAGYITSTESGGVINLKVEQKALTIKEYKDAGPTWWNNTNILSFEKGKYDKTAIIPIGTYVSTVTVNDDGSKTVIWSL